MPIQIRLNTTGGDTLVHITVASSPQHAEFLVGDSVTSIDFDPEQYILCKYETFYGIEELVQGTPLYNDLFVNTNPSDCPVITYVVNQTGPVRIILYDISGRIQHTLYQGVRTPGMYNVGVQDLASGVYFCRLVTPLNEKVEKLIKVR
jgi:hypothetical protein